MLKSKKIIRVAVIGGGAVAQRRHRVGAKMHIFSKQMCILQNCPITKGVIRL